MEEKTDLTWKPKTWKCPKCRAIIGNDHKTCPICEAGPIHNEDIRKFLRGYYRGSAGASYRNY